MKQRCNGITKNGSHCRSIIGLSNGYCKFHREQNPDKNIKNDFQNSSAINDCSGNKIPHHIENKKTFSLLSVYIFLVTIFFLLLLFVYKSGKDKSRH